MSALIRPHHVVVVCPPKSAADPEGCMFVTAEGAIVWTSEAARAAAFETMFEAAEDGAGSSRLLGAPSLRRALGLTRH